MSGHIVNTNIPHPLLDEQLKRYPQDLRVECPFCHARPGQPCVMSWTHPARSKEAQHLQPKIKTVNDLPNTLKKDLLDYCEANKIDPRTLHEVSAEVIFDYWCKQHGFMEWSSMFISVWDSIKEIKG